jgi:hypothetical protein
MKNKKLISAVVALVALIAVISGTFAWISLSNKTTTGLIGTDGQPGGTVHDDFDGQANKEVYVENWGTVPIFVRVRLSEYMETGKLAGTDSVDKDAKSLVPGATFEDKDSWSILYFPYGIDPFREYWNLSFGGTKYYKPVELKDQKEGFIANDTTVYDGTEPGIKKTRGATVYDMAYWVTNGGPEGDYWVADTDGWIYWASPLNPGEATGLLVNQITKVKNIPGGTYYYGITADTQMATAKGDIDSPGDFNSFSLEENGGWTPNAKALLHNITGNGRIDYEVPAPAAEPEEEDPVTDPDVDDPAVEPGEEDPVTDPDVDDPAVEPGDEEPETEPGVDDPAVEPGDEDPETDPGVDDPAVEPGEEEPTEDPGDEEPVTEPGVDDPAVEPGYEGSETDPGVDDPAPETSVII